MNIYVAGPMTGLPEFNFPAFFSAARLLRSKGFEVFNPAEVKIINGEPYSYYMRKDIALLIQCDEIFLLQGWRKSKGARLEYRIAKILGMKISEQADEGTL